MMEPPTDSTHAPLVRVLVADDEAAQLKALCDSLREHGYAATGCSSGKAALAALRSAQYDLLLSDLEMPDLDGVTLLRAALEIDPTLAGIIVTGQGTIDAAVRAMKTGAIDFILKPFRMHAILPVLERAAEMRRLRLKNAQLERQRSEDARELARINDELRRANQHKSEFLASMSHELRTPLNAVIGFTELIRDGKSGAINDRQKNQLDLVLESAHHLLNLINDVLDLSRIEAGRTEVTPEWFSPRKLVERVFETVAGPAARKQLNLVQELRLPAEIYSDRVKLFQVLLNLVNNAVKFTDAGQVKVSGWVEGKQLTFEVADTGVGMKAESMARLFEPFTQVDSSSERRQGGAGLGLHICKRFAQLLGGDISAESSAGEGSRFTLMIPVEARDVKRET